MRRPKVDLMADHLHLQYHNCLLALIEMKEGNPSIPSSQCAPPEEFSLAVASRALAASTVSYLEPQARGMTFAAFDAIVKDTLLPPFSNVVSADECGKDLSSMHSGDSGSGGDIATNESIEIEQALDEGTQSAVDADANTSNNNNDNEHNDVLRDFQTRFNGDYELYEQYDRSGKQKVRCLVAVIHGKVKEMSSSSNSSNNNTSDDHGGENRQSQTDHLRYIPGSISMTFRGTDTLENVIADVRALTVQYNDAPFLPSGVEGTECTGTTSSMEVKFATVHQGFRDAWYGDELRQTVLQYISGKIKELNDENVAAKEHQQQGTENGLIIAPNLLVPTIDIVGHSLGGSVAILAAFDLAKSLAYIHSAKQAHIRVYTMGCPRVGNVQFAKLFNKLVPDCWNVINDNDIVPAIPYSASMIRSWLPAICPCRETGYRRHGHAVILKDNGELIVNPNRRMKYRREVKVLRLKKAVDSHMTCNYRSNIRAAIQNEINQSKKEQTTQSGARSWIRSSLSKRTKYEFKLEEKKLPAFDDLLERLGSTIDEALADPNRSLRFLPGGT